jgi:hypothetical protein
MAPTLKKTPKDEEEEEEEGQIWVKAERLMKA